MIKFIKKNLVANSLLFGILLAAILFLGSFGIFIQKSTIVARAVDYSTDISAPNIAFNSVVNDPTDDTDSGRLKAFVSGFVFDTSNVDNIGVGLNIISLIDDRPNNQYSDDQFNFTYFYFGSRNYTIGYYVWNDYGLPFLCVKLDPINQVYTEYRYYSDLFGDNNVYDGITAFYEAFPYYDDLFLDPDNNVVDNIAFTVRADQYLFVLPSYSPVLLQTWYPSVLDGLTEIDNAYNRGFADGDEYSYDLGYNNGYEYGHRIGYDNGLADGISSANEYSFFGLISAVIDVPVQALMNLVSFEVFGYDLSYFVLGIFSLSVIIFVIKIILSVK